MKSENPGNQPPGSGFEYVGSGIPEKEKKPEGTFQGVPYPRGNSTTNLFSILVFALCFLLALYLLPSIASQVSYSLTRGSEKAKVEAAKKILSKYQTVESQVPWVVKRTSPSVVGIQQIGPVQIQDDVVEDVVGIGSGVIVDADGYILTNYHVIAGTHKYVVLLSDGRRTEDVRLIGFDRKTDLAVLKIGLKDLTPMPWGDSDSLEVGEPVLAIGSPYGLSRTVTQGIISAKERYTQDFGTDPEHSAQEYLQTDAAVNPGNSGGPLVNMRGEMIGINTAIVGESYRGISFAIPSALARKVYEEIRKNGRVAYGMLGIQFSYNEGKRVSGAEIAKVYPNFPADKAGIKPGDIITHWNGMEVRDYKQLNHAILFTKPGTKIKVTVLRNGEKLDFEVTVAQRPVISKNP
ncbi:MAG: trypsin-like peptidase domain-containing protein [Planctomycetaceae bacterium]|nr:trypsin-like peptidase domain-containing protein [Planctomycetaceae bacterium]